MYQKVSTLKFCNFNFVLEGIKCFNIFEAARVGSWLGWIFNFGFGSVLFGMLPFERTVMVFPLSILILMCYADVLKNPSKNVINTQKTTRKYGIIGVTVLWAYALLAKIASFYRA
jgi:hypothetical protein